MTELGVFNYWVYVLLMMIGLYAVIDKENLVKKVMGLSVFQTGIFIFYVSMGVVTGGTAPVYSPAFTTYTHPLPTALILTAIVVSVSTLAVALAVIVRIGRAYGTIEESEILAIEREEDERQ